MKVIITTALVASFLTLLCVFVIQFPRDDSLSYPPTPAINDLTAQVQSNLDSITALSSELRHIRDLLEVSNRLSFENSALTVNDSDNKDLVKRLEAIEVNLAELSKSKSLTSEERKKAFDLQMKERSIPTEVLATQVYQNTESHFERDSGKPLGDYSNSIEDAIHSVDGIDVKGVDCGETICKITYSKSESLTSLEEGDVDSDLADKLMFGAEGRVVELKYADDSMGNRVIYAELK